MIGFLRAFSELCLVDLSQRRIEMELLVIVNYDGASQSAMMELLAMVRCAASN